MRFGNVRTSIPLNGLCLISAAILLFPGGAQAATASGLVTTMGKAGVPTRLDPKAAPVPVVVWLDGPSTSGPPGDRLVLSQKDVQFSSPLLVVVVGQTVDMPNQDEVAHNVYSRSEAKSFNLGIYGKGATKSVTFDQVGLIDVQCSIHRRMRAKILVVPNSYHTLTAVGGRYQISGVPVGQYTLHAWSKDFPETQQKIAVPDNGDVTLNVSLAERN